MLWTSLLKRRISYLHISILTDSVSTYLFQQCIVSYTQSSVEWLTFLISQDIGTHQRSESDGQTDEEMKEWHPRIPHITWGVGLRTGPYPRGIVVSWVMYA